MRKFRVLIVDDDAVVRRIVTDCLAGRPDFEVVGTASDGEAALSRLNQGEAVDLILVDWNMPKMNGFELVRNVRANALFSKVRIMMITVENSLHQVEQALAAGADEYLMKPFTRQMLFEKLAWLGAS